MVKTIASGLFIINKGDKLLVAHPTNHDPNFWSIPKGRMEEGETTIETALRETQEEVNVDFREGYTDGDLMYFDCPRQEYKNKNKILESFVVYETYNPLIDFSLFEFKCNSSFKDKGGNIVDEMDDFKWVTLTEALEILHPTQVQVVKELI